MVRLVTVLLAASLCSSGLSAKPRPTWTADKLTDPITGKSSCTVAALDSFGKDSYTRVGAFYPMVQMTSEHGLLVGVSSGGRYRIPPGDILWRVDDLPFRELKAANNPVDRTAVPAEGIARLQQETTAMMRAMTATSTMASGKLAWDMLAELRGGRGLQFRQAMAVGSYGLPQQQALETGQITAKGARPYPLDESFAAALTECGIGDRPTERR